MLQFPDLIVSPVVHPVLFELMKAFLAVTKRRRFSTEETGKAVEELIGWGMNPEDARRVVRESRQSYAAVKEAHLRYLRKERTRSCATT
jgi:hypothetical protein